MPENMSKPSMLPVPNHFQYAYSFIGMCQHLFIRLFGGVDNVFMVVFAAVMNCVLYSSASVLDRLNALLEPNGSLSLSERGVIDGAIPTVVPHPEFRYDPAIDSSLWSCLDFDF